MKKAIILGVLAASSMFAGINSKNWSEFSRGQKAAYVMGVVDAAECDEGTIPLTNIRSLSYGTIVAAMDALYADPLNSGFGPAIIYQLSVFRLNGTSDKAINDILIADRKLLK